MYQCKCRALTKDGKPVFFTTRDVPVQIYPDSFILANRPNSPVLTVASMCRAMDHLPVAEGDIVLIDGIQYTTSYNKGFFFVGQSGVRVHPNLVSEYTLVSIGENPKHRLLFKHKEHIFQLPSFLGCMDGKVVLSISKEPVDVDSIQVSVGLLHQKRKLFYGDVIDGAEVIMWRGRPCVRREEGYVEVPTGNLLGGVAE